MIKKSILALLAIPLLAACTEKPVSIEQRFIDDAATALGGADNIRRVSTLVIEAEGLMPNLGQDLTPDQLTMQFEISDYKLSVNLDNGSSRLEQTRTPLFEYFRGPDPIRQIFGIAGDVAYDIAADGSVRRAPDTVTAERQATYFHHPITLLKAALQGTAVTTEVRSEGDYTVADITTDEGVELTLAIDAETKLPAYISSVGHHFYLRDVVRQSRFSQYEKVDGLMMPTELNSTLDELKLVDLRVTSQQINADLEDLSAPSAAASAEPITGPAPANVTAEEIVDGIWFLAGQSHHSVLIEFSDHLMLVEAPNESRVLAVLAKAQEIAPDKPVTHVVNTHHHFDHSAGIRAAVSRELTIITHEANASFYRRMAKQPSMIEPDALAGMPKTIKIDAVAARKTYEDDSMSVEIYHIADNSHSHSMLMVYLPEQRLVIEADVFTPGRTGPQAFAPNFLENIEQNELQIDRIVPIHGGVTDFAELESVVRGMTE